MAPRHVGLIPTVPHPRTIAIDLDDTLNNFTETLQHGVFPYDPADSLPEDTFEQYLQKIRRGELEPGDLLITGYSYCRFKIHVQCYKKARARPDGVEFMQWLRRKRWRIVLCTRRDLRQTLDCTKAWLEENGIPFDYLFMAANKIVFCKAWGIQHLVDDEIFNIVHGDAHGVRVYYPILPAHAALPEHNARGFQTFEEVKQWILE